MNRIGIGFRALACFGVGLAVVGAGVGALMHQRPSSLTVTPSGKMTPWAAMKAAAGKTGGRPFQAVFEFEDGTWQYGVMVLKVGKISEVEIDANTGSIKDVEGVSPGGEAREVKAELEAVIKLGGK